jgi:hypothetical protein
VGPTRGVPGILWVQLVSRSSALLYTFLKTSIAIKQLALDERDWQVLAPLVFPTSKIVAIETEWCMLSSDARPTTRPSQYRGFDALLGALVFTASEAVPVYNFHVEPPKVCIPHRGAGVEGLIVGEL